MPPLAISFFTFHQILYLIDNYNNVIKEQNFLDYLIFITFFPSMIMGPITHYNDIIDNIKTNKCSSINDRNLFFGISFFIIGLMKKVIIANSLSFWVINGFDVAKNLNIFETWLLSLCYTFQIYFDFSGYSDMATGSALMFNVKLPVNFNSPYKSTNIQEFWHRWHMTLSNFWQSYIYIPLGGSRKGEIRTILNILIVFLVSGIWHGAGSTYIVWGLTHGVAMTFCRIWKKSNIKINKFFGNMITFIFINITWIFFRSDKLKKALKIIETMFNFRSIKKTKKSKNLKEFLTGIGGKPEKLILYLLSSLIICKFLKNSNEIIYRIEFKNKITAFTFGFIMSALFITTVLIMISKPYHEFIYSNF